jgi:uncharacterized Rmd1/YagE family protein
MSITQIKAFNIFESLKIKDLRQVLPGVLIDSTTRDMLVELSDGGMVFVFQFGAVVFFNASDKQIEQCLALLKSATDAPTLTNPTSEQYNVKKNADLKVEFDFVGLPEFSIEYIRLVAMTVGQSAALEHYEKIADDLLQDSHKLITDIAGGKGVPWSNSKIVKTIGRTASARQNIVSNVWVLDPPEDTWTSAVLEKLFKDLQQNFDIDLRFRTLEKKLMIVQDNNEILANLASAKKAAFLELTIILLIVFEIVMALIEKYI